MANVLRIPFDREADDQGAVYVQSFQWSSPYDVTIVEASLSATLTGYPPCAQQEHRVWLSINKKPIDIPPFPGCGPGESPAAIGPDSNFVLDAKVDGFEPGRRMTLEIAVYIAVDNEFRMVDDRANQSELDSICIPYAGQTSTSEKIVLCHDWGFSGDVNAKRLKLDPKPAAALTGTTIVFNGQEYDEWDVTVDVTAGEFSSCLNVPRAHKAQKFTAQLTVWFTPPANKKRKVSKGGAKPE